MFVYLGGGGGIQCIAQHPWNACGLALTGCPLVTLFELVDHQAWAHPCLVGASLLYMVVPLTATKTRRSVPHATQKPFCSGRDHTRFSANGKSFVPRNWGSARGLS